AGAEALSCPRQLLEPSSAVPDTPQANSPAVPLLKPQSPIPNRQGCRGPRARPVTGIHQRGSVARMGKKSLLHQHGRNLSLPKDLEIPSAYPAYVRGQSIAQTLQNLPAGRDLTPCHIVRNTTARR